MSSAQLYRETLLDHFHHPRNKGDLSGADSVKRGSNPRCGDEVEIGLFIEDERIAQVRFRGRGCSICIASASMMTEIVAGLSKAEASQLCDTISETFRTDRSNETGPLPQGLEALAAVQHHPARSRCVTLSWQALAEALAAL